MNGIPMFFIHMVAWLHFGVPFAKLDGQFRIAFYIELSATGNTYEQEKLFADFKNQGVLAEGKPFCYARFSQAIIANFFNVQG